MQLNKERTTENEASVCTGTQTTLHPLVILSFCRVSKNIPMILNTNYRIRAREIVLINLAILQVRICCR